MAGRRMTIMSPGASEKGRGGIGGPQRAIPLLALFTMCSLLYVLSLLTAGPAYSQGLVFMAKKITGDLPLDPADGLWKNALSTEVPLAPQVMAKPRIYESKIKVLNVKALHNAREIAFLIEWADQTEDAVTDVDKFSDAVSLEFPSSSASAKPHFAMGDRDNTVNIWYWKAAWQRPQENGKGYATFDDFAGGIEVSNPVSKPRKSPVENIIAGGFGSATDMEKGGLQDISGIGKWQSNRWAVVFKRSMKSEDAFDVSFREGAVTPVAFAVWNGSDGDRGGRKVVSTWYYVGVETEAKKTIYIYPAIGFIAALGAEAGMIIAVRKRRKLS